LEFMKEHLEKEEQELFPLSPPSASPALPPSLPTIPPTCPPTFPPTCPSTFPLTCPSTFPLASPSLPPSPTRLVWPHHQHHRRHHYLHHLLDCSTMERPEIPSSHSCPLVCSSAPATIDGLPSHVVHLVLS